MMTPRASVARTPTEVAATKNHGPRLILFGGATAIEGSASSEVPGIRLDGVTNSAHLYDVETRKWTRLHPIGEPPSPRAAHTAAAVGTMVVFQPDRVTDFCKRNKLQLIIRAHECVMDGFERFAHGQLITLFSATNDCGTANNAGAILVVGWGLVVVPKLIHPLPPPL